MKSIWVFAWGVLKKWWALMSCAAFTVLGVVSAYSSHGSKWTIAGTFGLAVAFGFVGVFQLWSEEHQRANRAEQQLAQERENPRVTSRDWQELAEKFEVACPHVRANYQVGTRIPYDFWTLSGDSRNTCEAWIKKGGAMLLKSPQVCAQLPRAVRLEPDPMKRWLKYLKENRGFRSDSTASEKLDDGTTNHIMIGSTHHLSADCARLCIECSVIEL